MGQREGNCFSCYSPSGALARQPRTSNLIESTVTQRQYLLTELNVKVKRSKFLKTTMVLQYNKIISFQSTLLIIRIGHRKEIQRQTTRALNSDVSGKPSNIRKIAHLIRKKSRIQPSIKTAHTLVISTLFCCCCQSVAV